jgi:hypothetical protein
MIAAAAAGADIVDVAIDSKWFGDIWEVTVFLIACQACLVLPHSPLWVLFAWR